MKKAFTLFLTLMLVFIISTTAFAETPAQAVPDNQAAASLESSFTVDTSPQAESPSEPATETEPAAAPEQEQPEAAEEESAAAAEKPKGGNTPYFVGAVIAVIVFIGVALYCKFNGNGNISR